MVQAQKNRQATKAEDHTVDEQPELIDEEQLDASTADILDEIDEVIGVVGEEWALQYRQQGGQ